MKKIKKAQVSLYIIIAIAIIALAFFSFIYIRPRMFLGKETAKVENKLESCVEASVKEALKIAGIQAGFIKLPEFVKGSSYMPFSNYLNFLGLTVPYWFYVSGNNIGYVQKPSLDEIEKQVSEFVEENLKHCNLEFENESEIIEVEKGKEIDVDVKIKTKEVKVDVRWPIKIKLKGKEILIEKHKVSVKSYFGLLYETASEIFDAEQKQLFLENYSLDILNLYAPVTGFELSCAPKTWKVNEIEENLKKALEANIQTLKVKGNYYKASKERKYFEVDVGKPTNVNVFFLFTRDFPFKLEVWPSENGILKAEPIGLQKGLEVLSALGFCYLTYHFVYDMAFPVLVQLSYKDDFFQFPVLVLIYRNRPRISEAEPGKVLSFDICEHKNQLVKVKTYDENMKPVEARIYYKCFNQKCFIGETKIEGGEAFLEAKIPQCYNGFLIAEASGFKEAKIKVSSLEPFEANLFLKPKYKLDVEADLAKDEKALIVFDSKAFSFSLYLPEQKEIELSEGTYNVTAYLFKESRIELQKGTVEKCVEVPLLNVFGMPKELREQCFTLEIPEQELGYVLSGGGKATLYVDETFSKKSKIKIRINRFAVPENIEEIPSLFTLIKSSELEIEVE